MNNLDKIIKSFFVFFPEFKNLEDFMPNGSCYNMPYCILSDSVLMIFNQEGSKEISEKKSSFKDIDRLIEFVNKNWSEEAEVKSLLGIEIIKGAFLQFCKEQIPYILEKLDNAPRKQLEFELRQ